MRKFNTRILSLLMALVMSFSLVITAFAADIPDGYTTDDFGRIVDASGSIVGYIDSETGEPVILVHPADDCDDAQSDSNDTDVAPDVTIDVTPVDNTDPDAAIADEPTFTDENLALVTSFKDVKSTAWYYKDVMECAKLGIVAGFEDGTFRPEDKVSSVQLITMLTRTFYASKLDTAAKSKPAGTPWYWANKKVADDVGMSKNLKAIDDNAMNRYEMARALYNTAVNNGKSITSDQSSAAIQAIKDYKSVPSTYRACVKYCYALGIITGMSNGNFEGNLSMTRAQACTVIMRMLKLINNYNPGDKDNDQYDDGKSQDTGNDQNQNNNDGSVSTATINTAPPVEKTKPGKLSNGKDATPENVAAMLAEIQRVYPTGTIWGPRGTANNNYYNYHSAYGEATSDVGNLDKQYGNRTSLQTACGGWACMVSEYIFGRTGAPCRRVTDRNDVRVGDITIYVDSNGIPTHYGIVCMTGYNAKGVLQYGTCSGNMNTKVNWETQAGSGGGIALGTTHVYTRYPN